MAPPVVSFFGVYMECKPLGLPKNCDANLKVCTPTLPPNAQTRKNMERIYRVLYIEDNLDNRVLIQRFLEFEGFEVFSAANGRDGLHQATQLMPDIFLVDLNLPDMSGYEVIHALTNCHDTQHTLIEEYTQHLSYQDFLGQRQAQDSVIRRLEIMGEAVKNLPRDFRQSYPEVSWRDIAGLRDVLIHNYLGMDLQEVWQIIEVDLPKIKPHLSQILSKL